MSAHGSSKLNEEQTEFYRARFGLAYRHVQTTPFVADEHGRPVARASRAERRRRRFRPRSFQ